MSHDHTSHDHAPDTIPDVATMFTPEFWDDRYRSAPAIWSGNPNPRLVEHVADLAPGAALDVGCGEGADAIWLAARGWKVTGIDVSTVALTAPPGGPPKPVRRSRIGPPGSRPTSCPGIPHRCNST